MKQPVASQPRPRSMLVICHPYCEQISDFHIPASFSSSDPSGAPDICSLHSQNLRSISMGLDKSNQREGACLLAANHDVVQLILSPPPIPSSAIQISLRLSSVNSSRFLTSDLLHDDRHIRNGTRPQDAATGKIHGAPRIGLHTLITHWSKTVGAGGTGSMRREIQNWRS
jgi:hypothetical protein